MKTEKERKERREATEYHRRTMAVVEAALELWKIRQHRYTSFAIAARAEDDFDSACSALETVRAITRKR